MTKNEDKYFLFDRPIQLDWKYFIKCILAFGMEMIYKVVLSFWHPRVENKKYKVTICAIFKDEALYLREWIEFHKIVGVDHFYLYNNFSNDKYLSILEPYIKGGVVTLIDWPVAQGQLLAYNDCIQKYKHEAQWIGFIDLDEFIVPRSSDHIYDFLKKFEKNRGSVLIHWRLYGTSGKVQRDYNHLVTEDFFVCWPKYDTVGKCFYNTNFVFEKGSKKNRVLHHTLWTMWKGLSVPPVNVFDHFCIFGQYRADSKSFPIQINHYFTKSFNEYLKKAGRGDVFFAKSHYDQKFFYWHEMKCTSVDYSAWKYIIQLKERLGCDN